MAFRAKKPARVYAELARQKNGYGTGRFLAVDNIIPYEYFRELLPWLRDQNPGISLFYEVKSNLKRSQVELLRDAGVLAIQPGIESLSSHVLHLMRKGVTALQNVQLLRLCEEFGVELAWNLLYGFPGETRKDYEESARTIEAIYHPKPPGAVSPVRLDRFSPHYEQAESFGLAKVRPFSMYRYLYPLPEEGIANLAYFFEYEYSNGYKPQECAKPAIEKARLWKEGRSGKLVKRYGEKPELTVIDTRFGRKALHYPFNGIQRELYDFCDEIRSHDSVAEFANQRAGKKVAIDAFLEQMVDSQLMLREERRYLSLAVDASRRRSKRISEPVMF